MGTLKIDKRGFVGLAVCISIHVLLGGICLADIQTPVLKWAYGGCYSSWCETGWYSSPAVVDIDGDGVDEVIGSAYSIAALDGETGALRWRVSSGHDISETGAGNVGRTWPAIVVQDIDGDGEKEIAAAHGGGWVSVYDLTGRFKQGWPRQPSASELRGLMVVDLEGDGVSEVVVSAAVSSKVNTWIYSHDGVVRNGWPQLNNDDGYAYGVFNDNAAAGDLDNDGDVEIVVPSDVHYICTYGPDGGQFPANSMYGGKGWGKVGVWEDPVIELRGWGACDGDRSESYRTNFAHGASVVVDVDGDGTPEVVAVGNVYDCNVGHPPGKYNGVYIFNSDRSRYTRDGYDWTTGPVDTGAPLSENYNEIESCQPNPVVVDLDGDGFKEILFASYDGKMHAYGLNKTSPGSWPYSVYAGGTVYRFASEPVVADLDNNGYAEILFASWTSKGSGATGKLHVLDHNGIVLHEIDLPAARGSATWNGALAAPTLGDIDGDGELEIVLNTAHSGFIAYDLPGTSGARILWGTGRAGRIWQKPEMTEAEKVENALKGLKALAGESVSDGYPDPDGNSRTEMSDVLYYLK